MQHDESDMGAIISDRLMKELTVSLRSTLEQTFCVRCERNAFDCCCTDAQAEEYLKSIPMKVQYIAKETGMREQQVVQRVKHNPGDVSKVETFRYIDNAGLRPMSKTFQDKFGRAYTIQLCLCCNTLFRQMVE